MNRWDRSTHVRGAPLTGAQVAVLRLIAEGCTNAQIAERLGVTENTVRGHRKAIHLRLGVHTATRAVIAGINRGLVSAPAGGVSWIRD